MKNYITTFRSLFYILSLIIKAAAYPGEQIKMKEFVKMADHELGRLKNKSGTTQHLSAQIHGKDDPSEPEISFTPNQDLDGDMTKEVSM